MFKKSGILWPHYRDEPFLDDNGVIANFPVANNNIALLKVKQKITDKMTDRGTKDVEIMVPLKYLTIWLLFKFLDLNI